MKKSWKGFLIICLVILFCTGCNGKMTRDLRKDGFSAGSDFICDKFYPASDDDIYYNKIKYFIGSHLIDQDGKIYELSTSVKYSTGENCKEAQTSILEQAILDNKIIKGKDNKYYYLEKQNNSEAYTEVTKADNSYAIYDLLLKPSDVVKVSTISSGNTGLYYILKSDGNVYEVVVNSKDRNTPPKIISSKVIYDRSDYQNMIVDYNYAGDSIYTFVKTPDKVFRMMIVNPKECAYPDIECEYEMREDEIISQYKDRIITFNGNILITDYKKTFTLQKSS